MNKKQICNKIKKTKLIKDKKEFKILLNSIICSLSFKNYYETAYYNISSYQLQKLEDIGFTVEKKNYPIHRSKVKETNFFRWFWFGTEYEYYYEDNFYYRVTICCGKYDRTKLEKTILKKYSKPIKYLKN